MFTLVRNGVTGNLNRHLKEEFSTQPQDLRR